jgi:hypothetical protein
MGVQVLPRHAYGFVACRWGWTDRAYIESILTQFRSGGYPIDSFISDFEWYTPNPDYSLPDQGACLRRFHFSFCIRHLFVVVVDDDDDDVVVIVCVHVCACV